MGHISNPVADAVLDVKYPILDEYGFVSLVDYMGGDHRIAEAAWVSSMDEVAAEKKSEAAVRRIINYMMANKHSSPFEQTELTFRCKMPIFVARQWIRTRTASVNEMSGRYRILPTEYYIPKPERLQGKGKINKQGSEGELTDDIKRMIIEDMREEAHSSFCSYAWYDRVGLANEVARMGLPLQAYTEWYWKIDLHNFFHFTSLRLHPHAQWEIQQYAIKMYELAKLVAPTACEAFEEHKLHAVTLSRSKVAKLRDLIASVLSTSAADVLKDLGL